MRSARADIDAAPAPALVVDEGLGLEESLFDELGVLGVDDVNDEAGFMAGAVDEVVGLGFADVSSVGILCFGDAIAVS
jgi:hypothetical protein